MLKLLLPFQRFFVPCMILLVIWAAYRTIIKKDRAVGLALYLSLVIILDYFMNTGIYVPGLASGSIRYSELCAIFLILNSHKNSSVQDKSNIILILICIFFFLLFISCLHSLSLNYGINNFRRVMVPQIIAFFLAYKGFKDIEDYYKFSFYLMILFIFIGLFCFWDIFFDRWIIKGQLADKTGTYAASRAAGRYGSIFLNPNMLATFAVLFIPGTFVSIIKATNIYKRIFCLLGTFALIFAFVETQSRGPYLAFVITMLIFVFLPTEGFSLHRKIRLLLLLLFVLCIFMPGFFKHSTQRFNELESEYATEGDKANRGATWRFASTVLYDNLLFGVGFGEAQYKIAMERYGFLERFPKMLDNPHNGYIQMAIYAGAPVLIIFLLFNIILIIRSYFVLTSGGQGGMYLISLGSGIVGFLACLMTGGFLFYWQVSVSYWVSIGLLLSLIESSRANTSNCNLKEE